MKTVYYISRRAWLVPMVSLALLVGETPSRAQSGTSEFRRQGDVFSQKVSGFFGRLFGGSSQQSSAPVYQQMPSQGYQQAPQHRAAATQQPNYNYAPSRSGQQGAAAPQRIAYTQAPVTTFSVPKVKSGSSTTAKKSTRSTKSAVAKKRSEPEPERPVYTSTKRSAVSEADQVPSYTRKSSTEETVLSAPPPAMRNESPKTYTSLASTAAAKDSELYPFPSKPQPSSAARENTPAPSKNESAPPPASTASAGQEFPKGTPTSKPGRVISPYEPHNELDVQGLSSGSLALDPTTQKVFKIP